jgi:hypothetical protein
MEKKCKKCNQLKTINEFSGKNQICNFCKDKRKNRLKLCKKCNQLKIKESEFNYGMKICNECQSKRRQVVKSIKKRMNVCHCRYCNSETNNKGRICDYCRNTIKCKRCKKRLSKDKCKTTYLTNRGWIVLRFWEKEINNNIISCVDKILQNINARKETVYA